MPVDCSDYAIIGGVIHKKGSPTPVDPDDVPDECRAGLGLPPKAKPFAEEVVDCSDYSITGGVIHKKGSPTPVDPDEVPDECRARLGLPPKMSKAAKANAVAVNGKAPPAKNAGQAAATKTPK